MEFLSFQALSLYSLDSGVSKGFNQYSHTDSLQGKLTLDLARSCLNHTVKEICTYVSILSLSEFCNKRKTLSIPSDLIYLQRENLL